MRVIPLTAQSAFKRYKLVPFDSAFGLLCVYAGFVSFFEFGLIPNIISQAIGRPVGLIFAAGYFVAGLGLFLGIGLGRRNLEAFGLITIVTSLVVRSLVILVVVGFNAIIFNNYISNGMFLWACMVRFLHLYRGKVVMEVLVVPPQVVPPQKDLGPT